MALMSCLDVARVHREKGYAHEHIGRLTNTAPRLTLVLVALLKNAELRSERAIQQKLDAITSSLMQDKRR